MSIGKSLLLFVAIAVPLAAMRIGFRWWESRPPLESSRAIIDPSFLQLREVTPWPQGSPPPIDGAVSVAGPHGARYAIFGEVFLDLHGFDAGSASLQDLEPGSAQATLRIRLTRDGDRILTAWTKTHVGRYLGILVKGELVQAPVVMDVGFGELRLPLDRLVAERIREGILAGGVSR
ncbi:MAG: hypothetical protein MUE73_05265 [Planctomycetes bacterium]|jgi:hypothetical protein|nr:hypothetical protein [Planctomycetota bacterium]